MRKLVLLLALLILPALALPEAAPDVALSDAQGQPVQLSSLVQERPVCLVWWCSTCPSCRTVDKGLDQLAARGGNVYVVCASAGETPDTVDSFFKAKGHRFPVLFDQRWALTGPIGVKATTTALILDKDLQVRYYGRFQEDQKSYAKDALDQLAQGQPVALPRTQPFGCVIPKP